MEPSEVFEGVETAELQMIALELYRFSQAAVSSHKGLILTPSSQKAKAFSGQLGALADDLREKAMKPKAMSPLASRLAETVGQYASWQNAEYDRLVADFTSSLEKIVQSLSSNVKENEELGGQMTVVEKNLRRAAAYGTIEEIRSALTEQVAALHDVVQKQNAIQTVMKRDYEASIKVLSEQLELSESRGRTDFLTKLPNRSVFEQELQVAFDRFRASQDAVQKRRGSDQVAYSLALTDLNMFKWINDTLGHPAGDTCLKFFAGLLRETFNGCGFCARLAGDEFVILYPGPSQELTGKIRTMRSELLKRPVKYDPKDFTQSITLAFSFGVADMMDGDTPESLYKSADGNMYEMKRALQGGSAA